MAAPIPLVPPVTTATRLMISSLEIFFDHAAGLLIRQQD